MKLQLLAAITGSLILLSSVPSWAAEDAAAEDKPAVAEATESDAKEASDESKAATKNESKAKDDSKEDKKSSDDKPTKQKAAKSKEAQSKEAQSDDGAKAGDKSDAAPGASKAKGGSFKDDLSALPGRVGATAVAAFVGMPIALVRKSAKETVIATRDLVGDTNNWFFIVPAGALAVPAGILSGTLQAPFVSTINAWKNSDTDPFGKDAFSLGDMD